MNKSKILTTLLDYLNFKNENVNSENYKKTKSSPEENFIRAILRENKKNLQKTPPVEIYSSLIIKKNILSNKISDKIGLNKIFDSFFRLEKEFILSSISILVFVFILAGLWKQEGLQPVQSRYYPRNFQRQYLNFHEGDKFREKSINLHAMLSGTLAFEEMKNRQHFFIQSGYWHIDANYAPFDKEIWLHFPGGGVKPNGAEFYIQTDPAGTKITLSRGKIQTYHTDSQGIIIKTSMEEAPYTKTYKNFEHIASLNEGDFLAEKSNSMVVQKNNPEYNFEQISAYKYFIGSYISVLLNDGTQLSGILKTVWNETINIQTRSGIIQVPRNNMTLVELNTRNLP